MKWSNDLARSAEAYTRKLLNGFSGFAVTTAIQVRSDGNVIEGNFIGTNDSGTAAVANDHAVRVGDHDGSTIVFSGSNNQIGGVTPAARMARTSSS